jgi:hypothetical protein
MRAPAAPGNGWPDRACFVFALGHAATLLGAAAARLRLCSVEALRRRASRPRAVLQPRVSARVVAPFARLWRCSRSRADVR